MERIGPSLLKVGVVSEERGREWGLFPLPFSPYPSPPTSFNRKVGVVIAKKEGENGGSPYIP